MGKIPLFIFIIFIVSQIIRAIMQAKDRLQKDKASATGTTPSQATSRATATSPQARPSAPATASATSRAEQLAMRRKAQLEELRRRRAGGGASSPSPATVVRAGSSPVAPAASGRSMPPSGSIALAPTRLQPDRSRAIAARQRKLEHQQAHAKQEARARQREALEQKQARALAQAREREAALRREPDAADPHLRRTSKTSSLARATRARLRNRTTLRELIVLRELLDPPLAMRKPKRFPYGE